MEVRVESEEQRDRDPHAGKRRRPDGPTVSSPATVVDQTGREFTAREAEWLARLVHDPASFAAISAKSTRHRATTGRSLRRGPPGAGERSAGDRPPRGPGNRLSRGPAPSG